MFEQETPAIPTEIDGVQSTDPRVLEFAEIMEETPADAWGSAVQAWADREAMAAEGLPIPATFDEMITVGLENSRALAGVFAMAKEIGLKPREVANAVIAASVG